MQSYYLINQVATAHINQNSHEYLTAVSFLSYVSIVFQVIGLICGNSALVLLSRLKDIEAKSEFLSGAVYFMVVLYSVFVVALFILTNQCIELVHLQNVPRIHEAFFLSSLTAPFVGFNSFIGFVLVAKGRRGSVLKWDLVGNLLAAGGNLCSLLFIASPDIQFLGVLSTDLVVFAGSVLARFYGLEEKIVFCFEASKKYILRTGHMVAADFFGILQGYLTPLFFSVIFQGVMSQEGAAAYSVGFRLYNVLSSPAVALKLVGVSWLASEWEQRNGSSWNQKVKIIKRLSIILVGIPIFAVTLGLPWVLKFFFNLNNPSSVWLVTAILLSAAPVAISIHMFCQMKVLEFQGILAKLGFLFNFGLSLPLAYYLAPRYPIYVTSTFAILLPAIIRNIALYGFGDILGRERRIERRFDIPEFIDAKAEVHSINGTPISFNLRLDDISEKGFSMSSASQLKEKILAESLLSVSIDVPGHSVICVTGKVKSLRTLKRGFWTRSRWKLGIQFVAVTANDVRTIHNIMKSVNLQNAIDKAAA